MERNSCGFRASDGKRRTRFTGIYSPRRETALPRRIDKPETTKPVDDAHSRRREKIDKHHGHDTTDKKN